MLKRRRRRKRKNTIQFQISDKLAVYGRLGVHRHFDVSISSDSSPFGRNEINEIKYSLHWTMYSVYHWIQRRIFGRDTYTHTHNIQEQKNTKSSKWSDWINEIRYIIIIHIIFDIYIYIIDRFRNTKPKPKWKRNQPVCTCRLAFGYPPNEKLN